MTRPIPRLDPRCPTFLSWLCEEAERQEEQSRSALFVLLQRAKDRGDTREQHRIGELLRAATNAELAKGLEKRR